MIDRSSAPTDTTSHSAEAQQLLAILERANQIASTTGLDDLLDQMLDLIIEVAGADAGTLYLLDRPANELIFKVVKGDEQSHSLVGQRIQAKQGLVGATIRERSPILVDDIEHDPRWNSNFRATPDHRLHNSLSFPLLLRGEPIGVIQIFNITQPQLQLIQMLGNRMASEIDKTLLLEASVRRGQRLQALIDIIGRIGSSLNRDQILRMIMDYTCQLLEAEASSLFLVDEETGDMVLHVASSNQKGHIDRIRVPAGQGIIGQVIQTGQTVMVADAHLDKRHYSKVDQESGFVTRSILAVPLRTRPIALSSERAAIEERTIGGLEALNKLAGTFNDEDRLLVETLASQAATVLQVSHLYADLNELFFDIIKTLTAAIDAKDTYTKGHSQRVSDFSVVIAQELGLDSEMIHRIRVGGMLHDVGKIGVPDSVLKKPGRLTEAEFNEIKKHPTIGEQIIGEVRALQTELPALAEHHERLDGKGYPKGLKGDAISLMGRIVATADAFDAMTSTRAYRAGLPVEEAFRRLQAGIGTQFDPQCVEALIQAYEQGRIDT